MSEQEQETQERRSSTRHSAGESVRLTFVEGEVTGRLDNVSDRGVLFFTDDRIPVEVELEENGEKKPRLGVLVRITRMSHAGEGRDFGLAVQFD